MCEAAPSPKQPNFLAWILYSVLFIVASNLVMAYFRI